MKKWNLKASTLVDRFVCSICIKPSDKQESYDYYMVKPVIWWRAIQEYWDEDKIGSESYFSLRDTVGYPRYLCLSCLEKALGRQIKIGDLLACPLNEINGIIDFIESR